jgi:hypothetical protein
LIGIVSVVVDAHGAVVEAEVTVEAVSQLRRLAFQIGIGVGEQAYDPASLASSTPRP